MEMLTTIRNALNAYLDNTNSRFVDLMEKNGAARIWRDGFDLYQICRRNVVGNYLNCVLLVHKETQ